MQSQLEHHIHTLFNDPIDLIYQFGFQISKFKILEKAITNQDKKLSEKIYINRKDATH